MKAEFARNTMSAEEREVRSRAAQLLHDAGVLHGSLVERERLCGKPNCRCARGERHRALIITVRSEGNVEQIYIPKHLEATVRRWVDQDHQLRDLLGKLARLHTEKIRQLKTEGARSSEGS
jgi:hypothetical protein